MTPPSRFRSLRWQLTLSYAAIALLAVLTLGIALLGALRSFYREQELSYLRNNAVAIAADIAPRILAGDQPALEAQIAAYAFLTQTRVQIMDEGGQSNLADSGELGANVPAISVDVDSRGFPDILTVVEEELAIEERQQIEDGTISSQQIVTRTTLLPAQGSLYGFDLGVAAPPAESERSSLAVSTAILNESGEVIGQLRLSQGPAYGRDILRSVTAGWALASFVAVLLAALAGWLVSRRLTLPLLGLTAVTGRMADGDLSVRADVAGSNEVGLLGHSFNRMAAQVEGTVNSLRQFTADSAHELHTPLTALQTDLQLLAATGDPAQQRQRALRAYGQARRLQDLVESLLELSQLEAETPLGERPLVDLTRLVQTNGELWASQAEQADLEFTMELPANAIKVRGDAVQLQQALSNVFENSLKFTPPPGNIVLTLVEEENTAVITIRDSGIGIPPEDLSQLFSRFHRGRNTAGFAGSGLGLAIVQKIMLHHNGQVIVQNSGAGTEVRLVLPSSAVGE